LCVPVATNVASKEILLDTAVLNVFHILKVPTDDPVDDFTFAEMYDEEKEIETAKRLGLIMQLPTGTYTQSDDCIE